jgi:GT2 family glycosyltransferase
MEEIDLCWRLSRIGYSIKAIPQSTVFHIGGGTLPNNNPHKLYLNYRNNLYLLFKNLTLTKLLPVIISRLVLDGMSAIVYLFSGSAGFFLAVWQAHLAFYCHIPKLIRKRLGLNDSIGRAVYAKIYPRSILLDFFIRKKQTFNQLDW